MEGALIHHLNCSSQDFIKITEELKNQVKKYNGTFTVLWHNSSFFTEPYQDFEIVLAIKVLSALSASFAVNVPLAVNAVSVSVSVSVADETVAASLEPSIVIETVLDVPSTL